MTSIVSSVYNNINYKILLIVTDKCFKAQSERIRTHLTCNNVYNFYKEKTLHKSFNISNTTLLRVRKQLTQGMHKY